jgi:hypothetical protein
MSAYTIIPPKYKYGLARERGLSLIKFLSVMLRIGTGKIIHSQSIGRGGQESKFDVCR